jgi:deoxyadenosine/deoxycytidine kinase
MQGCGKIIILESCPGAGKTTLGKSLQYHNPSCVFIPEEVNLAKLKEYLDDMENKAAEFQFNIQTETMKRLCLAAKLAKEGKIVVLERGLIGNSCFAELQYDTGLITKERIEEYRRRFNYDNLTELQEVEVEVIYMRASAEFCMQRILKRDRIGERNYTLDYITKLKKKHDEMLGDSVIVDCEKNSDFTRSGHLPLHFLKELVSLD